MGGRHGAGHDGRQLINMRQRADILLVERGLFESRAKDMLIRGGENIYCIEVENVLYEHPAVMDAALVAVPHKQLGEEPGAVVHLKPGLHATEDELRAFVAGKLAGFKVPVKIVFWPETLPRNANGKIMKNDLKKIFAEQK